MTTTATHTCAVTVFGVRHHGPGGARALAAALDALRPDAVLVEGPADAQPALAALGAEGFEPPVALLVYPPDAPEEAAFYPFAAFSPEWVALRWAARHGVPARLMDLPHGDPGWREERGWRPEDPIAALAEAAGHDDPEAWWELQVEQRRDAATLFEAIAVAMAAAREAFPADDPHELRREAHMRQAIRAARAEGRQRIAVVCGAWHAPALAGLDDQRVPSSEFRVPSESPNPEPGTRNPELGPGRAPCAAADAALLADRPARPTAATWIPWTHARLARHTGYGAGVDAPGWYDHLWRSPERAAIGWVAQAARLLRAEGQDASAASVVEAVRLAEALAAVRGRPAVGLDALMEAIEAVLCAGRPERLALVRTKLAVGDVTGVVPAEVPGAPLRRDLEAEQKRLKLKQAAEKRELALDLREPTDRGRSALLHRLAMLDVPWGRLKPRRRAVSTFHEDWELAWLPDFEVALIAKSALGLTIAEAARAWLAREAAEAPFPHLAALLDAAVLAALPEALPGLLTRLRDAAAATPDLGAMLEALPPLARVARYGDVRGTAGADVLPIARALAARVAVGLPGACASLDDEAAAAMAKRLMTFDDALRLLDLGDAREPGDAPPGPSLGDAGADWERALLAVADLEPAHGRVRGAALRLLSDRGAIAPDELARRVGLALGPATATAMAAAWIEGLVAGAASVLLQLDGVWRALDAWLAALPGPAFIEALPLLRRAYSSFDAAERRAMADKVRALDAAPTLPGAAGGDGLDPGRAAMVVPVLIHVMGG